MPESRYLEHAGMTWAGRARARPYIRRRGPVVGVIVVVVGDVGV